MIPTAMQRAEEMAEAAENRHSRRGDRYTAREWAQAIHRAATLRTKAGQR